jgi:Zn-dependent peptidase ImmA (M78 family)
MEELVEATGGLITKQSISKYELGKANPTPTILAALSEALGVKGSSLLNQPEYEITFVAYRKSATTSKKTVEEVKARVATDLENRIYIRDLICNNEIPDIPNLRIESIQDAELAAQELRRIWELGEHPIPCLIDTIEAHNIDVINIDAEDGFDGVSARAYNQDKELRGAALVTRNDISGARQRFNLAHELGHLVMALTSGVDEEKAAHRFSGAFLIPANKLIKELGPKRDSIYFKELLLIKKQFGVSIQALFHRMSDLKIISDSYYKFLNIQWNKAGFKRVEPEEFPCEEPRVFKQCVYRAFAENLIKSEQAERLLGEPLDFAQKSRSAESHLMAILKLPKNEREDLIKQQAESICTMYQNNGSLNNDDLYSDELTHA